MIYIDELSGHFPYEYTKFRFAPGRQIPSLRHWLENSNRSYSSYKKSCFFFTGNSKV